MNSPKLAIVTGASSGIGLEIAKLAAKDGYDLIVAADTPFVEAAPALKELGANVDYNDPHVPATISFLPGSAIARSTCSSPTPAMASAMASSTRLRTSGSTSSTPT